jgi:hypothetical protein
LPLIRHLIFHFFPLFSSFSLDGEIIDGGFIAIEFSLKKKSPYRMTQQVAIPESRDCQAIRRKLLVLSIGSLLPIYYYNIIKMFVNLNIFLNINYII